MTFPFFFEKSGFLRDQGVQIAFALVHYIEMTANVKGNTAQFMARILLAEYSVRLPENPWKYTKYSLEFSDNLTKILTAQSAHRNCAVLSKNRKSHFRVPSGKSREIAEKRKNFARRSFSPAGSML